MPKQTNNVKEMLLELEKLAKKIIRKSLKDNTLDYTVQFTISSLEPGLVKYAAQISSPATGVEPITYVFDSFADLKNSLVESEKKLNRKLVEIAFHQSRVNTFERKVQAHKQRIAQLEAEEAAPAEPVQETPTEEVTDETVIPDVPPTEEKA